MRSFSLMPKIRASSDVVEAVETLEPNVSVKIAYCIVFILPFSFLKLTGILQVEGLDDSGTLPLAADSDVEKVK